MSRIIIIGGGTFEPIRNHLSLSAPAFGTTAKQIHEILGGELVLTKMADPTSKLKTNKDLSKYIDTLIEDKNVKCVVLSAAFCDYYIKDGDFHGERLSTSDGDVQIDLTPSNKVIDKIRRKRPDIFLVGFKTTTNKIVNDQFLIGLKMMKRSKCNLVLANDTVTRNNIIITPEESYYGDTTNREDIIKKLCDMITHRMKATYNRTNFIVEKPVSMNMTSETFQKVINWLIRNDGFIENNGNGFTPGHFCQKIDNNTFLSSQRKADHNKVFQEGLTMVQVSNNDESFTAIGSRKPSVGARSQWLLLKNNPEFDCIVHTHNPLKWDSKVPKAEQYRFQCGSLECGMNTLNNLGDFGNIKAVYLEKHGINILFKSTDDWQNVVDFIDDNILIGEKTI